MQKFLFHAAKDPHATYDYDYAKLSVRAYNVLANANCWSLAEVLQATDQQILAIGNCGRKTLNELREVSQQMAQAEQHKLTALPSNISIGEVLRSLETFREGWPRRPEDEATFRRVRAQTRRVVAGVRPSVSLPALIDVLVQVLEDGVAEVAEMEVDASLPASNDNQ